MSNTVDLNCRLCRAVQVVPVDQICISWCTLCRLLNFC